MHKFKNIHISHPYGRLAELQFRIIRQLLAQRGIHLSEDAAEVSNGSKSCINVPEYVILEVVFFVNHFSLDFRK